VATRPPVGLPKLSRRSRILLIIGVAVLALLITGSRLLSTYVDWAWYGEVGFRSVFSTVILTRIALFFAVGALVGGITWLSLYIAYRARPVFVPVVGADDPVARYRAVVVTRLKLFGLGVPLVVGLLAGASAQADWAPIQLFLNGGTFGVTDQQFGNDIGFYAFKLPFYTWTLGWLFVAVAIAFIAGLVAHYLFGGIRLAGRGGQMSSPARMQLAITAGTFVLLKAVAYFFDRYELLFSDRNDKFTGASYTDLNAVLPAKLILLCIAVFCAIAFFVGAFLRNLQLPAIALVLLVLSSILVGGAWPLIMEQFSVKANANSKEAPQIERNIAATRLAYGIGPETVKYVDYDPKSSVTAAEISADKATVPNVRLLDPNLLSPTFSQQAPGKRNFYGFPQKLNIDRYSVGGVTQDYIVAAREISSTGLAENQRDWINKHLVYTHGDGFVSAPANTVNSAVQDTGSSGGYPIFSVSDQRNAGKDDLKVDQPRIYYGLLNTDYAIVGGNPGDAAREYDTEGQNFSYTGSGGVPLSSWLSRLVFAAHYGERNFLFSNAIGDNSKLIFNRDPRDRVNAVAPWLTVDGDPYPAVVDGKIKWIVDGYTTLDNYPYAQRTSLGEATSDSLSGVRRQPNRTIGYIRNSVKATVDAYDGTISLYAVDESDPVLKAWQSIFPGTVKPSSEVSDSLRKHFRYPEDLFKVQRDLLTSYHVDNPQEFYSTQTFWSVPPDPTKGSDADGPAQPPYYVMAQIPGQEKPTFQLTSVLTRQSVPNMAAWMSVDSDPGPNYGKFTVLKLPLSTQTDGPVQVQTNFDTNGQFTQLRTLFNNAAVNTTFGNMLTLPVAGGLLYVEPLYIQRKDANSFPQFARVLVRFGNNIGIGSTLRDALDQAFGPGAGSATTQPSQNGQPPTSTSPQPGNPPPTSTSPQTLSPELAKAADNIETAFGKLKSAQQSGDFEAQGRALKDLNDAVTRFQQLKSGATAPPSTPPATTTSR
jgi:uncharacterized membrane protein (UPF0182 family)